MLGRLVSRSVPGIPPLGDPVPKWTAPPVPGRQSLQGDLVRLEPLDAKIHGPELFASYQGHDQVWDYLPYGPFETVDALQKWIAGTVKLPEHQFYAIRCLKTGLFRGVASYLRIAPEAGSIEVGHINFSLALQGTAAATEAMFLMMKWAFEVGYRRYEWKCDALNRPSRQSAQRLGFSFEGIFRQATVVKGRNRDTAWFAITDKEWPALNRAFKAWLSPSNQPHGQQQKPLGAFTSNIRVSEDPTL